MLKDSNIYNESIARATIWYAVVFTALSVEWWLLKEGFSIEYLNALGTMLKGAGDIALILLPYWLLGPRLRWTALLAIWILAISGVANLAYLRFWGDLIPPASVTMGGNVDGNLMQYGASLLRVSDIAFVGIACAASAALPIIRPSKSPSMTPRGKALLTGLSLLAGLAGQASYLKTTYAWRNAISPESLKECVADHYTGGFTGQKQLYLFNGPVYYGIRFVYDAIDLLNGSLELTEAEKADIADFLRRYEGLAITDPIDSEDYATTVRSDSMNVVYIIVESLNADMVGRRIGDMSIMPVLDSLAHREGTVVLDNVVSQIKASSSSDGHLLLMTGLLPPEKASYSIMYGSRNSFPSLADALPDHHKYLLLADEGVCWNEGNTLRNFGLGEPITLLDRPQYPTDEYGRDEAMFLQAAEIIKNVEEPFLMTLMTISMHIPFKEKAWPIPDDIRNAEGLTQMEKDYSNMCRHTDRSIGEFLKSLPENTLVIIASDHHQDVASGKSGATRAFFMAVNSGRTERISRTVGQVNLFPATLDILGIKSGYRGLAPSAFDEGVDGTQDSYGNVCGKPSREVLDTLGRAYEISDLIIRGDYFRAKGR